jgi:hypothetical protein
MTKACSYGDEKKIMLTSKSIAVNLSSLFIIIIIAIDDHSQNKARHSLSFRNNHRSIIVTLYFINAFLLLFLLLSHLLQFLCVCSFITFIESFEAIAAVFVVPTFWE